MGEDRLIAICNGFQGLGIVIPDNSQWMGSPSSCRSYARSVISHSRVSTDDMDKGNFQHAEVLLMGAAGFLSSAADSAVKVEAACLLLDATLATAFLSPL
ncbi:hypothetical protein AK812_SmicGene24665 [Symbiodinium microadriaticum]|uniref:Uncharacterized protein n=1 Tax=Symbiodinium microadriaticum TaxID=2951 RepID=A0A1Q9DE26_SYMMI|nr:hypothetical protein AK812_SmicGene24665 [Symbiodinium microadriaticum]